MTSPPQRVSPRKINRFTRKITTISRAEFCKRVPSIIFQWRFVSFRGFSKSGSHQKVRYLCRKILLISETFHTSTFWTTWARLTQMKWANEPMSPQKLIKLDDWIFLEYLFQLMVTKILWSKTGILSFYCLHRYEVGSRIPRKTRMLWRPTAPTARRLWQICIHILGESNNANAWLNCGISPP